VETARTDRSTLGLGRLISGGRTDPSARTELVRRALLDRFERQVDPDCVLSPEERARRAGNARKAYFARLALRSAQAPRKTSGVGRETGRPEEGQPQ
jgi:hypothetical protein